MIEFESIKDLWNSAKVAVSSNELHDGFFTGTLEAVTFGKQAPISWVFTFLLDGSAGNGEFSGQRVIHSLTWHNKEKKLIAYMKDKNQKFCVKLCGKYYAHDFDEMKDFLESLKDYPVQLKVTKRYYTDSKGKEQEATDISAIPAGGLADIEIVSESAQEIARSKKK